MTNITRVCYFYVEIDWCCLFSEEIYGVEDKTRDIPECSSASVDPEMIKYECLSASDVDKLVKHWVAEVSEAFSITSSQAKLLLQLNNWDFNLLKKEADENAEEFLIKTGLKVKEKQQPKTERRSGMELRSKIAKKDAKKQQQKCGVCWEEDIELTSLDCGHTFCTECWPG